MLKSRGITAYPAARKPPLDPNDPVGIKRRQKRLQWALERQDWTIEDFRRVIFTDEAFIKSGWHRRPWIYRFPWETYHETAVMMQSQQNRKGFMIWGLFAGCQKGRMVIWDKS